MRSYAVVMVAEDAYGTGRSWIKDILTRVLQGHVNTASLPQLYGKGTSAEQTYNDWMACCQFLVVEEAKDSGLTAEDFYHGYETFKQMIDTKVSEGRRTYVVENPSEKLDYTYYDRLTGSLMTQEPRRVYWWLMHRDVGSYDHVYPPMTPAKARMIEDTRAPSSAIAEYIQENHAPDLVTRASLRTAVILAARVLDFDKQMQTPGPVVKILWRKMKSLNPDDTKNGARYKFDGKQTEVRAVRNQDKFVEENGRKSLEEILAELEKTGNVLNMGDYRGNSSKIEEK